jgi:hypothetical protein
MLRYRDLPTHTTEVLDVTSLTVEEFTALVGPFEAAFLDYMEDWTLHGRRRQAQRYTTYKNYPLPTPEDRLLFLLVYLKQHPTHLVQESLFGMRQSKATQWIHVLLPVLRDALRTVGDAPCRTLEAWRVQLGVADPPLARDTSSTAAGPAAPPLFVMMGPSAPSRAARTRLNRRLAIATRKSGTW